MLRYLELKLENDYIKINRHRQSVRKDFSVVIKIEININNAILFLEQLE